jgi:hypothetical protein
VAVTVLAGSAVGSTGRTDYSAGQAGYAAAGARFKETEVDVKLPDASRFADEIGRLSLSVQLRAVDKVVELRSTGAAV